MVLLSSNLLNREISLKLGIIGRKKNQIFKREGKICFLDGWQSNDAEKICGLVSLAFLQCKPHVAVGKLRVILCLLWSVSH